MLWWLLAVAAASIMLREHQGSYTDFVLFRNAGLAWRGLPPGGIVEGVNLNSPVWLPVFAAFSYLPTLVGLCLWMLGGAASLAYCVHLVVRERRVPVERLYWLLGAIVLVMPMTFVWVYAQVTWFLLYPVTRAWLLAESSPRRAAYWLAVAVVLKPPLALAAVLLPWRIAVRTAITGALVTIASVGVFGWPAWRAWLSQADAIQWLGNPLNLGIVGVIARLRFGHKVRVGVNQIDWTDFIWIAAAGAVLAVFILRKRHTDTRWILAIWWSLLLSPLGWAYYLPLALGPLLASWRQSWMTRASFVLFAIPITAFEDLWRPAGAWACTVAFLLLGAAYLTRPDEPSAGTTAPRST